MDLSANRRLAAIIGAAVAVFICVVVIGVVVARRGDEAPQAEVSGPGLVVQSSGQAAQKLDPAASLKCYVGGRLVGEMPVADCAKKNGVATGPLEVGVTKSEAAASNADPTEVAGPPPPPIDTAADRSLAGQASTASGGQPCWSHEGGAWSRSGDDVDLPGCVQQLFSGQCLKPGAVAYGRWGNRTLRLVAGRVEISAGGNAFHTYAQQGEACVIGAPE